jgi:pyridoxal phosphate enzyme (YggS family)
MTAMAPAPPHGGFRERLETVLGRIGLAAEACGRNPASVSILAVSKFHPVEVMREAMECGVTHFAENYVQEGASKSVALPGATFALIGPLQRNKAKPALKCFRELMTVDRPELATRLSRLAEESDLRCDVWIQVDLWEEESKMGGCAKAGIRPILDALAGSQRLPLKGLMAIPPIGASSAFGELADLREEWQQHLGERLLLSMGMSGDMEEAIKAGSDQVRVGTALFGERIV